MKSLAHRQLMRCEVINTPDGLKDLMGDITREVLRSQPPKDCLFKFIADYLQSSLETRNTTRFIVSIIDEAIQSVYDVIEFEEETNYPKVKSAPVIDLMEASFQRFMDKYRCAKFKIKREDIKESCEDLLTDVICKWDEAVGEIHCSRPAVKQGFKDFVTAYEEAVKGKFDTKAFYQKLNEADRLKEEYHKKTEAAIQIQSVFRGHRVRLSLQKPKKKNTPCGCSCLKYDERLISEEPEADADNDEERLEWAATKIQSAYRKFRNVRHLGKSESEHVAETDKPEKE